MLDSFKSDSDNEEEGGAHEAVVRTTSTDTDTETTTTITTTKPKPKPNPKPKPKGKAMTAIPQENWEGMLCNINAGPFAPTTGRVVSWGNGWITLNTRHGLHKRHAFELTCAEKRGDDNDNDNDNDDHNDHNDHNDDDDESLWPQIPVEVDPDAKVPRKRVQKVKEEVSDDDENDKDKDKDKVKEEEREKKEKEKEEKEKDKDKEKEKENSNSNSNSKEKKTGGRGGKKGAAKKNSKSPTNTVIDGGSSKKDGGEPAGKGQTSAKSAPACRARTEAAAIGGTAGPAAGQHHNCLPNPKQVSERSEL